MKLKYFITIPLGYLILICARSFSLRIFRYNIPMFIDDAIYVSLDIGAVLLLVYLYNKYVLKGQWRDIYICRPAPRLKWVLIATILSTFVLCCCLFLTEGTFVTNDHSVLKKIELIYRTILLTGVRAGVTEEIIYRGFIFGSLQKIQSRKAAVISSAVLFAVIHLGNIDVSNIHNVVSLMIAIIIIGIAFALITLETGSIWSAVAFHGIYNIISGDMDILHVSTEQMWPSVWSYIPVKEYRWITGIAGSDDIETGLPAMLGFVLVSILAVYFIKKKKEQAAE